MTTLLERPLQPVAAPTGGGPARRAVIRWSWRMFRREWRRQVLVMSLLLVAVAATTVGLALVSNAAPLGADPSFGTANTILSITGSDSQVAAALAAIRSRFSPTDVVSHASIPAPGSVSSIDLRGQDPAGPYGHVMLRVDSGRYPAGPAEVAVTRGVAQSFGLKIGSTWTVEGKTVRVVGLVENPLNLLDQFALFPPGQVPHPANVSVLLNANQASLRSFHPGGDAQLGIEARGTGGRAAAEAAVLALGTLGLIFVGLMAVAGFAVMAQRRMRALGMLGSLGATDRHLRLVMLANGAAVGGTAAVAGVVVGVVAWIAFTPILQSATQRRVDRLALPWLLILAAMLLAFLTAMVAAWWPARTVSRIPIMSALSGRPPRPQPAHRFAALGGILLSGGLVLLSFADQNRAAFIIAGTLATSVGLLFLAPLAIRLLARAGRNASISARLALRDLVRYQARSGAALGAVTMAVGISATIAISASAAETPAGAGNLPSNQLILYLAQPGAGNQVPPLTATQQQYLSGRIDQLRREIHASAVLALEEAYDPASPIAPAMPGAGGQPAGYPGASMAHVTSTPQGQNIDAVAPLYVATPELLAHYGITPEQVQRSADIITSRTDLGGLQVFLPSVQTGRPGGPPSFGEKAATITHPSIQVMRDLPAYTSAPATLITPHAMQVLGFQSIPSAWLVQTPGPVTSAQVATARQMASSSGLRVETRNPQKSLAPLRNWSTAAGILIALGVLGMTVGLIRSETASDLRTLTATGASPLTRRNLTGFTAGAIALLGAVIGMAGSYAALLAWHRSDLSPLGRVPIASVVFILVGLPLLATVTGWLLAGGEVPAVDRKPLE